MREKKRWLATLAIGTILTVAAGATRGTAQNAQSTPAATSATRKTGTVKSISGSTLTVIPDGGGAELTVTVQDSTRIVRLPPGSTDLKAATPMEVKDVQIGDRMLLRGAAGATPDTLVAASIIVMKQADVAQKQQQDLQDWQKRGAGGIVTAVDTAGESIIVAVTPTVTFVVKTSKTTVYLRYATDSIKFSDAKKGTFDQIKTGDQLRARGNRSADGKELTAEEVISGAFRNIAGTISSVDIANNSITVKDILAKKSVVVKLTADSQVRKLPPQLAQRIAFFLKGAPGGSSQPVSASGPSAGGGPGGASGGQQAGQPAGPRPGGGMDFQQMISRLPAVTLAELQKEDAVMIVSTLGSGESEVTAITLLSGVEPILTASPNGMSAAALLSGWNLSAPGGDAGAQ
ncbi:MAG TPA: DUF5666 domain-containing protein [Terriglobales bacterium]